MNIAPVVGRDIPLRDGSRLCVLGVVCAGLRFFHFPPHERRSRVGRGFLIQRNAGVVPHGTFLP
jgi:hypothetical protein